MNMWQRVKRGNSLRGKSLLAPMLFMLLMLSSECSANADCTVLLHGLARSSVSMNKIESALSEAGYTVVNYGYPSTKFDIPTLAEKHLPLAIKKCGHSKRINFVTHSMGAIILRQFLDLHELEALHRVVMLGPPNHGSEVVDELKDVPGFELINGPAGMQLGTKEQDLPNTLGSAQGEVGIIAGASSINLILSLYLPEPNDGKVSVESTKLSGMKDHLVVDVSHPFLMYNKQVIEQVIAFLSDGKFKKET